MFKFIAPPLAALILALAPSTAGASVTRFAFQTEGFGLSSAQRTQGASTINAALDTLDPADVSMRDVRPSFTLHGAVELFAQADFASDASGQSIFNSARNWLSTRATDAADGRHSYVRVVAADDNTGIITTRYAESPGWATSVSTLPLG